LSMDSTPYQKRVLMIKKRDKSHLSMAFGF